MEIQIILMGGDSAMELYLKARLAKSKYHSLNVNTLSNMPKNYSEEFLVHSLIFTPLESFHYFKKRHPSILTENLIILTHSPQLSWTYFRLGVFDIISPHDSSLCMDSLLDKFKRKSLERQYSYSLLNLNRKLDMLLPHSNFLSFKTRQGQKLFKLSEINTSICIKNSVWIFLDKGRFECTDRLLEVEERLAQRGFLKFGKYKMVNKYKIVRIIYSYLHLANGEKLSIEKAYLKGLKLDLKDILV